MSKFKTGDIVICVNALDTAGDLTVGQLYKINSVTDGYVILENSPYDGCWRMASRFELYNRAKISVGVEGIPKERIIIFTQTDGSISQTIKIEGQNVIPLLSKKFCKEFQKLWPHI
jgi:hypothetical protein